MKHKGERKPFGPFNETTRFALLFAGALIVILVAGAVNWWLVF